MRKILLTIVVFIACIALLGACNNDSDNNKLNSDQNNKSWDSNKNDNLQDNELNNDDGNDGEDGSTNSNNDTFKVETADQLDLRIGDTGKFDTTLGAYEVTLNDVEFIDSELDGRNPESDIFIILDITLKNTSNKTQDIGDLIGSLEVTEDLEASGTIDASEFFESFEKMSGSIAVDEEVSGQLVMDIYEGEEYYLYEREGNVAAGLTNQVIWTFTEEESR